MADRDSVCVCVCERERESQRMMMKMTTFVEVLLSFVSTIVLVRGDMKSLAVNSFNNEMLEALLLVILLWYGMQGSLLSV